jgi:triosephosphate isomerase
MTQRRPFIAGNWKMHTTFRECIALCDELLRRIDGVAEVDKVVCPPFPYLHLAVERLKGSTVRVGAQNMHWEEQGAYTGEVSPVMLAELVEFVVIGHSERRQYFGETDENVNRKLKAALAKGLRPILCVGETLEERDSGRTEEVLVRQVRGALVEVSPGDDFITAYEPVWAIGTGIAAHGPQANQAAALIRAQVADLCGDGVARSLRVLYGGSVSPDNIAEFMEQPEVDGALVGGASLKADSFSGIVEEAARVGAQKGP